MIIKSSDQTIKYPLICKKGEKFKELEQKIYEKYPNLKNEKHFYLCKGNIIDIEKTIEENKIKDNDIILINITNDTIITFKAEINNNPDNEDISVIIKSMNQDFKSSFI